MLKSGCLLWALTVGHPLAWKGFRKPVERVVVWVAFTIMEPFSLCCRMAWMAEGGVGDSLWFVAVACPNQSKVSEACRNHVGVVGCGTLCNLYHGITVKHAQQLMWNALHFLNCVATRQRGQPQAGVRLGYADTLLGEMGFKCEVEVFCSM